MKSLMLLAVLGVSVLVSACSANPLAPSAALASSSTQTIATSASAQPVAMCGDFPCGSVPSPCKNVGCVDPTEPSPCRTPSCAPDPEPPCGQVACRDERHTPDAPLRRVVDVLLSR